MFERKKKNKSGKICIQIIDKSSGKYKVVKTIGSYTDSNTVEVLYQKAKQEIQTIPGQLQFNFEVYEEKELVDLFFNSVDELKLLGPELLLGKIFDQIGFNKLSTKLSLD